MRLWSLHPKYLDSKGLVALWRESLLARNVLEGKTKGYRHHPQLARFRGSGRPLDAINAYLSAVYDEAHSRGFKFDARKKNESFGSVRLTVTRQQMEFEAAHMKLKLAKRDKTKFYELDRARKIKAHPLFIIKNGGIESWEKGVIIKPVF
jgi:hypothetical protein